MTNIQPGGSLAEHVFGCHSLEEGALMRNPHSADIDLTLQVNGRPARLRLDSRVTLLDALREHLGLTGTKKGCDQGACGSCDTLRVGH
jgi:hypothetical protein